MPIAIVAGGEGWHVQDLRRAANERGIELRILDFRHLCGGVNFPTADPLADADAILIRTMPAGSLEQVIHRMDVLHAAESRGQRIVNRPRVLETAIDKYLTSVRLAEAGLPTPPTWCGQSADAAMLAFEQLGGDVVVKPLFGSEGRGMVRVSDIDMAWRTFHTIERTQAVLYLQAFIAHPGYDVRVFVLGGRVIATMRRYARTGWRTNVAQGGRGEPYHVSSDLEELALRGAATIGADVAGVDLLPGPDGAWYVLEINAVPGWRALAPVCGVDIAGATIDFLRRG